MCDGLNQSLDPTIMVSITGIAGPQNDYQQKRTGLVFRGNRLLIRLKACNAALNLIENSLRFG